MASRHWARSVLVRRTVISSHSRFIAHMRVSHERTRLTGVITWGMSETIATSYLPRRYDSGHAMSEWVWRQGCSLTGSRKSSPMSSRRKTGWYSGVEAGPPRQSTLLGIRRSRGRPLKFHRPPFAADLSNKPADRCKHRSDHFLP